MSVTPSPTVVGVFRDRSVVEQVIEALYQAGFAQDQIRYSVPDNTSGGFLNDLKHLFTGPNASGSGDLANDLTGMGLTSEQARYYANEYDNGNIVMAVQALDNEQQAMNIFHQFGAYGIHNTLREAEGMNEDAGYAQPQTDFNNPSAAYAQQSTDYQHQMSPYTQHPEDYAQQPASSTWGNNAEHGQPLNEETNPRQEAVTNDQTAVHEYANDNNYTYNDNAAYNNDNTAYNDSNAEYNENNADYTEQNSTVAPAGAADQRDLPDNIQPESVVDHQQNLPEDTTPIREPSVSDEHLNAPDHQDQAAQDYRSPETEDDPTADRQDYNSADNQGDITDETTQPVGSDDRAGAYRAPATDSDTQNATSAPVIDGANREYPTTVTYDETPGTPAADNAPLDAQPANAVDNSTDNTTSTAQHTDTFENAAYQSPATHNGEVATLSTNYNTEPDLSADQGQIDEADHQQYQTAASTTENAPLDQQQAPQDATAGTTATDFAAQREERLRQLQQRLESAKQRLQDSQTQLQAAKEHESQLQSMKQQLDAIEAELEKNEAELRETHARIEQYY
ncbi:general stress protein [Dictyobacter aurantiacus]|uniref:General stress protein 17M-like domain-containing protein n=1 Tax=Dictyobacter aurantiacus TaxID=1936993 RepID=A0A401ZJU7_9CHLR|nr:general stress protein [Dictyobacter aurantiacus]GCE07137.1 hypothetical protein KDAU_44660 [Dictyobacter aurantiacus]